MFELAGEILKTFAQGRRMVVATTVGIEGSAPRSLGTSMAVDSTGQVFGSIAGGCVESAVYESCLNGLKTRAPVAEEFGFDDADAFSVGLTCGGRLTIAVQEVGACTSLTGELERSISGQPAGFAVATRAGRHQSVTITSHTLPGECSGLSDAALGRILEGLTESVRAGRTNRSNVCGEGGDVEVTYIVATPPPRMIIFCAVDYAGALANSARLLGYAVTICDPRPVFATNARFPEVEVIVRWPTEYLEETALDGRTVICILSHDDRFEVSPIAMAVSFQTACAGAMGSRSTHSRRIRALRDLGVPPADLDRLHSPIGLDIGASSPEETATSILAEVVGAKNGFTGHPLAKTRGSIRRSGLLRDLDSGHSPYCDVGRPQ
jgi:xanthine dehydrogenase accessory factor